MYVKCRVEVDTSSSDETQNLLAINEMALQPGNFVWKVVDEKLKLARVEIVDRTERGKGDAKKGVVIVRSLDGSIAVDDEVVVTPLSQPTDGAIVKVADAADAENSSDTGAVAEDIDSTVRKDDADADSANTVEETPKTAL
jgi:hypothetical protein